MEIKYREANINDKDYILRAHKEIDKLSGLKDSIFEKNINKDLFDSKVCKSLVAYMSNDIVGFVLYSYIYWTNCGKGIYLSQAYVDKKYRKKGLLKSLLKELENREPDCNFITDLVGSENEVMLKCMNKLNFKSSDLLVFYRKIDK